MPALAGVLLSVRAALQGVCPLVRMQACKVHDMKDGDAGVETTDSRKAL